MSTSSSNSVADLRAALAKAEANDRQARADERAKNRADEKARLNAVVDAHRAEAYDESVGDNSSYVGLDGSHSGGVTVSLVEYVSDETSASFTRDEALAIHAALGRILGI